MAIKKLDNATRRAAVVRVALYESLEGYKDLLRNAIEDNNREDIKEYKLKIKYLNEFIDKLNKR